MPDKKKAKKILHGNAAQVDPHAEFASTFMMQAISDIAWSEDNTPMVDEADVIRERNWGMENEK